MRPLVPRFLGWDAERSTVITELVEEAQTLLAVSGQPGQHRFAMIGRTLAAVHGSRDALSREQSLHQELENRVPWILDLAMNPSAFIRIGGGDMITFLALLEEYPALLKWLGHARSAWVCDAFIHGDLRWDNILLVSKNGYSSRVVFADWELYDLGDSAWDIATIIRDALLIEFFQPGSLRARGPAIPALLAAYLDCRPALRPDFGQWRSRVVIYAVTQLCLAAFEQLAARVRAGNEVRALVGWADQLGRSTESARLGLPGCPSPLVARLSARRSRGSSGIYGCIPLPSCCGAEPTRCPPSQEIIY